MHAGDRHYDQLEQRDPVERQRALLEALPDLLRHAMDHAPGLAAHLDGVDPGVIDSASALADLPVLRKASLVERQQSEPPLGGLVASPIAELGRVFVSPGPIYEPEGAQPDHWRFARAMYAAGFRRGDLVHNGFSYHLTPAGAMMESAARALGCPVFPAGTGQTERQVQAIAHLRPVAYVGTPSFLKILLDRGRADGLDLGSFCKALVGGEAFPKDLAGELSTSFGIDAYQCYGTADVGLIAYETPAREGLVIDEGVLVEIVRPGTGDPVAAGEVGEVVVTTFNRVYPLIRFATGDLSTFLAGTSPCGRTNRRLAGWLGRADQTAKVKGMFVHPSQIAEIVERHREVVRARLVVERVDHLDRMRLHCEVEAPAEALTVALEDELRTVTGLRGEIVLVAVGELANDGKVIDDRRPVD
jgi:phenylacetate-CoA ligase